jgi:hypothetical protein
MVMALSAFSPVITLIPAATVASLLMVAILFLKVAAEEAKLATVNWVLVCCRCSQCREVKMIVTVLVLNLL